MIYRFIPLLGVVLVAGCAATASNYQRPDVPSVNIWQSQQSGKVAPLGWQQVFPDAALQQLVKTALDHNRDLSIATLNVMAYEAQYRIQRAALLPTVDMGAGGTRQRTPARFSTSGQATTASQYSLLLGTTAYELDMFGRVRGLERQALEKYLAEVQNQRTARLSLVANVVNAYLTWVADREQLQLAKTNLAIEQSNIDLVNLGFQEGVASDLERSQAEGALQDVLVAVAQYQRLAEQDRNALTQLLGTPLPTGFQPADTLNALKVGQVLAGLPSSVLDQRPDLLAAEHQLQAANANITVAKAALFPSIRLTASGGALSPDLEGLFDAGTGTWLFSPQISVPLFNGGALRRQVDVTEVQQKIAVAQYESAVQNAFTEVANALNAIDGYQKQQIHQTGRLAANKQYFTTADLRYRSGIDSMLPRLDAQRSYVGSQQAMINTRLALLQSRVDLYRALGGGWSEQK